MRLIRRVTTLCRALLHYIVAGIEGQNPEALLELERENLRRLIGQYNQGLASHAGLAERLMSRTRMLQAEETELRARIVTQVRLSNRAEAGRKALRLQAAQRELADCREQLAQAEKTYESLKQAREIAVGAARAKIESVRRAIGELRTQRAIGEMNALAAGLATGVAGGGETLERLRDMVEEQRISAAGRARVAREALGLDELQARETEQAALAEQALSDFLACEAEFAAEAGQSPVSVGALLAPGTTVRTPGDPARLAFVPIGTGGEDE